MEFKSVENVLTVENLKNYLSWDTNKELIIIYISTHVDQYLGYNTNEMIGKGLYNFITEDAKLKLKGQIIDLEKKREVFAEFEIEFITKRKDKKNFQVNMVRKFDDDKNFIGFCGICFVQKN